MSYLEYCVDINIYKIIALIDMDYTWNITDPYSIKTWVFFNWNYM